MKKIPLLLLLCLVGLNLFAQVKNKGIVEGKVEDTSLRYPLKDATIELRRIGGDSAIIAHSITGSDGSFSLANVPFGELLLQVSFQGYATYERRFTLSAENWMYKAGDILLSPLPKDLGTVVVRATPPIVQRGDTTEFNTANIKTKPNATAEDLLKKIPGMEVDKEGGIKAQGEQVVKILVDGKAFFSNDPKMATQNLPTDIIDKIQIIDAQSEQAAFTGFDDGNREKVINIITKKDKRKGIFGRGALSAGNDGRYGADATVNRFVGDRKITFVGKPSNTNQESFSLGEILSVVNAGGFGLGGLENFMTKGQSGVARTNSAATNYVDVWGKKTNVNAGYRYSDVNTISQQNRLRETFVKGDSSLFNKSLQYANNRNVNHQFNVEVEHKFDTNNSVLIRPEYKNTRTNNFRETNSYLTRGKSVGEKEVRTINNSLTDAADFTNRILFRHRFGKRGRTLSVNLNQAYSKNTTERTALNYTDNYLNGNGATDTTNRINNIERDSKSNQLRIAITERVGAKGYVELSYGYNNNVNTSIQQTNTYNPLTRKYDLVDTVLSNQFSNKNTSQRGGVSYRRQVNNEWSYRLGLDVQQNELSSDNAIKQQFINQTFNNFLPTANLQYKKNRKITFRVDYRGITRQPGIAQLQDVVDNNNVLNITRGNPGLQQEFDNNLNATYTKVDAAKATNLLIRFNGSTTANKIANAITINTSQTKILVDNVELEPLARYSRPVNINGAYNLKGYINYGFAVKKYNANINLSSDVSHGRDVSLVNNVTNYTRNSIITERVSLTANIKEQLDLNFTSSSTYNIARYSLRPEQNGNYFTQIFSVEPTYTTKSGWILGTDFDYTRRYGQAAAYNQTVAIVNASLSKLLFKKKSGELKVSVFDLLNQNKNISRNIQDNYIEDVRTNVLQRYFLLSFIYNLRQFGV